MKRIFDCWRSSSYFFHFERGGHVAAARDHIGSTWFARLDIRAFFDNVTRSKRRRALKRLPMPHHEVLLHGPGRGAAG